MRLLIHARLWLLRRRRDAALAARDYCIRHLRQAAESAAHHETRAAALDIQISDAKRAADATRWGTT